MALWTDINPAELTAFSRVAQESIDEGVLNTVLPNLTQDEVKFSWRVNQILSEAAEFGEFDTEAPIGGGDKSEEKTMPRIVAASTAEPVPASAMTPP